MKVFVAGATGVIGRRAVARLVAAGHDVTGVARGPAKAAELSRLGATPVEVDLFDADAVKRAVAGHEVVVNLTTRIPSLGRAALPGAWSENVALRRHASRHLVDAALAAGAGRLVQESIAFMYPDRGSDWLDEDVPAEPAPFAATTLEAEAHVARFTEAGGIGVVLRFGLFYGPDSTHSVEMVRLARRRMAPAIGSATGYVASVTTDDAADAVIAALDAPAGVFNVVDDEPLTRREYADALAGAVGARSAMLLPAVTARVGGSRTTMLARSQRVSNRRFKEATGWAPATPSAREGWAAVVAEMPAPPGRVPARTVARAVLALLTLAAVVVGAWAQFAPRSFYDDFPGGGRSWVSVDGPFNEHLVRDVGSLNLALAVVLAVAAVRLTPTLVRVAAAAALVWGLPHLLYHLGHLDLLDAGDQVANAVSLGLAVLGPVVVLLAARRLEPGS